MKRVMTAILLLLLFTLAVPCTSMAQAKRRPPKAPQAQPSAEATIHLDPKEVAKQMSSSHEEAVDVNNESILVKYIKAYEGAQLPDERQQIVTELSDFCIQRGLRPSPDLAEMFLALAQEAQSQGRASECAGLCRNAEAFDPDHPLVHLALADASRREGGMFSGATYYEVLATFFLSFKNLETRWLALSTLALWLRVTAFLVLAALALVLLAKYQAQLRHDVQEWMGGGDNMLVQAAGFIALFLPSLLFLAGYWWIIYWAGVFMLYARWPERMATAAAIIIFVGSGALAVHCQQRAYLDMSQPQASNLRCYANRIGIGLDASLASHTAQGDPLQRTYTFLLADRYLLHGSYAKAEGLYQSLLSGSPDDAEVANNLGCIYFYENRYQEAIQQFGRAIQSRADMAAPYLNRSLARNKLFDFTGAKDDQDKARGLDKSLLKTGKLGQAEEWSPVPSWIPMEETLKLALRQETSRPGSLTGPLRLSPSPVALALRPAFSFWVILFWVLFVAVGLAKKSTFFARACFKCGRPFCSRCKTSLEFESFCSQCVHLFIKQDGVSPEARLKKNYEVERYNNLQRTQRAIFSLLAPGAGHLLEGHPFMGLFLLFLWFGAIAALAAPYYALPFPYPALAGAGPMMGTLWVVALLLMLLVWGAFGVPLALRREPPRAGQMRRG